MQRILISLFGLGALAALAIWSLRTDIPQIEQDLHARATAALSDAGLAVLVTIDGQHATLGGELSTPEAEAQAVAAVTGVRGIRQVTSEITVRPLSTEQGTFSFDAVLADGQVVLSGHVGSDASRASLVGAARQQFGSRRVIDQLRSHDQPPQDVTAALRTALAALAALQEGRVRLADRRVELVGTAADPATADAVEADFAQLGRLGFQPLATLRIGRTEGSAVAVCQSRLDAALAQKVVRFALNSAVINADSFPLLDQIARAIKDCGGMAIEISGHTDSLGDAETNRRLSYSRASAVLDYLVAEGVSAGRLTAIGMGSERPLADNGTSAGRARNRRIELRALGAGE